MKSAREVVTTNVVSMRTSNSRPWAVDAIIGLFMVVLLLMPWLSDEAIARGLTTKADELRVTRTIRLTHPDFSYIPSHLCLIQPFNQDGTRVLLYNGTTGVTEWGFLSDLTSWSNRAEFMHARHPIPVFPNQGASRLPIWSVMSGEEDILYGFNEITNYIVRIDLAAGTSTNWVHLDPADFTKVGNQEFSYGFSDGAVTNGPKLIVCEDTDDPTRHVCEVDVVNQTYTVQTSYPAVWSDRRKDYPSVGHGHACASPDGTMCMADDGGENDYGYTAYLLKQDGSVTGLGVSPMCIDHVNWFYQNNYAIVGSNIDTSIIQLWTDGTYLTLLSLKRSTPWDPNNQAAHDRGDSWPFLSPDGSGILYHSDNGDPDATIGVYLAVLENANGENPVGVTYFRSDPMVVLANNSATLSWSVANAGTVSIDQGIGTVNAVGTYQVSPAANTTYTLTATGTGGPVSAQVTVEVATDTDAYSLIVNGGMERCTEGQIPDNWYPISGPCPYTTEAHADFSRAMAVWNDPVGGLMAKTAQPLIPEKATQAKGHQLTLTYWMKSPDLPGHGNYRVQYGYRISGVWTNIPIPMGGDYAQNFIPGYWKKYTVTGITIPSNINPPTDLVSITICPFDDRIGTLSRRIYLDRVKLVVDDSPRNVSIGSFSITPSTIGPGDACLMSWTMNNATSAAIDHGIGDVSVNCLSAGQIMAGGAFPAPTTDTTYTLTAQGVNGPVTATASVTIRCNLTMAVDPAGSGTTTPTTNSTVLVAPSTPQSISATANSGYTFVRWHAYPARYATFGDINAASTTVSLTGHCTVTAEFMDNGSESIVTLTTAANPTSCGLLAPVAGAYNVVTGTPIPIIAGPADNKHMFDGWTAVPAGNVTFGDARLSATTVTLTGSATVIARFAPNYLYNGSMEYWGAGTPEGWIGGGLTVTYSQDTDCVHLKYACKPLDPDTVAAGKVTQKVSSRISMAELRNKPLMLSAWAKGDGVSSGGCIYLYSNVGGPQPGFGPITPTSWTKFQLNEPCTFDEDDTILYVQVMPVGYAQTGTGWIDDVRLFDASTTCNMTMAVSPTGSGVTNPTGTVPMDTNVPFSIIALANSGYQFVSWSASPSGNASFGNGNQAATTVTLTGDCTVTANFDDIPAVTVTAPSAGQAYLAPVTLTATVADTYGTISKVEFFEGANQIVPDLTSAPYTYNWADATLGSHTIVAKATDSFGVVGTSGSVTFTVNDVPVVTMTSPASGQTYNAPITLTASVTNSIGTISKVQFFEGANQIGPDLTSAP